MKTLIIISRAMEENSRESGTAETASHAAINNSYVVYLLHFHRNWKSMLVSELGRGPNGVWRDWLSKRKCLLSLLRKGTSQWRCRRWWRWRWRRRRWYTGRSGNWKIGHRQRKLWWNLNASRHQNIYWARKVAHFMTDRRWKYKWKCRDKRNLRFALRM